MVAGGTCIPSVYRRRDDCVPVIQQAGTHTTIPDKSGCKHRYVPPAHPVIKQAGTPAHARQALLILCSWAAHSLLLLYFFSTPLLLLLYFFFSTSSLLFHYSFTTSSLLLYFFYLLLLCSLVRLPINRDNTSDCTSFLWSFVHTKSADLMLVIHQQRPSHCL